MRKNNLVAPVLKWVGGKRQLLETFLPLLPARITSYCEPFVGGGALLFHLQPETAYVNDINENLILVYTVIRDNVEELIQELKKYRNEKDFFYSVRNWDRDREKYDSLSEVERAARILYLNKTCYNGLYRVNSAGEFNSPFGSYRNPNIVIFQTVTSIQEQTLTFVPKIIAIFLVMMLCGSWMLDTMSGFMTDLWSKFSYYISMG